MTPAVVWSRSRRRAWNTCPRRFRWQYYGDDERLEALRGLIGERQWAARVVLGVLDQALRAAPPGPRSLSAKELVAAADRRITREWEGGGAYQLLAFCQNFPEDVGLHAIPGRVRERVRGYLRHFADSGVTQGFLATPPSRRRPPLSDRHAEVGGVMVAAPPLWSRVTGEGTVVLCVWSITNRPPVDAAEWATAGLLLCSRYGVALERLVVEADHPSCDETATFVFDAALLIEEQERILADAVRWRAALAQGESGFAPTPARERCRGCAFLSLCPEGRDAAESE